MALKHNILAYCLAFFVAIGAATPVVAIDLAPQQEALAQSIFDSVMSPYCPGRLLRDCPSGKAHDLKEQIRSLIAAGQSKEQISDSLYAQFGDVIRATPKDSGFGLVGWLAPGLFLLAGFVFVLAWLKGKKRVISSKTFPAKKQLSPEMQARIEREVQG